MPEVFFADEQSAEPVAGEHLRRLADFALRLEGVSERVEVNVLAVDTVTMADLNQRFLGKDGPTDVLAFPIDPDPVLDGDEACGDVVPILLGDVVICPEVAKKNAPDHVGNYDDELDLLIVHGILHLLGYDHLGDDQASRMEGREREVLAAFKDACGEDTGKGVRSPGTTLRTSENGDG